ncbi:hypothetical protein, partial [Streptomyces sp. NPDC086835]|uniref:hypothetical protein n=1 Tax=Streptomyces sp. NPDC086835 TaxID=3365761 RepID=UPI00382B2AB4
VAQSGAATGGGGTTPPPSGELTTFQVEGPLVAAGGGTDVTSTSTATCPAGSVVTGGGFVFVEDPEGDLDFFIMGNQRGPGDSWQVTVLASDSVFFRAVAECATLS